MSSDPFFARYGYHKPSERALRAYEAANQRLARERGAVYATHAGRFLASKADLRNLLNDAGLPRAAAEKIARAGWPALSPDEERAERLRAATESIRKMRL